MVKSTATERKLASVIADAMNRFTDGGVIERDAIIITKIDEVIKYLSGSTHGR